MAPNTRPRRTKAPASSPLSSPPAGGDASSESSASSPPSIPSSPYKPKPAPKKKTAKTAPKAQPRKGRQKGHLPPPEAPPSSPPPASLDDLLGNMGEDRELKLQRDSKRRKARHVIDSAPSSQVSEPKPKPKRKRKAAEETPRPAKKRSRSLDIEEDDGEGAPGTPSAASPPATSTAAPTSPVSTPRALVGPSMSTLLSTMDSDDDDGEDVDLVAALARENAKAKVADLFDGELSEPPTPPRPKWKKTVHPGVEPGDTCLVRVAQQWFPAKLLEFEAAETQFDRDSYEVQTQDGKVYHPARRSVLFLYENEAIAKVKIGLYQSQVSKARKPQLPADATDYERFGALDIGEQVAQLLGHLEDIAAERYAPAQWRVDMFHGGRAERERLREDIDYGDFRDEEVQEVNSILSTWVVEHEGTGRFATLAGGERSRFASYVLLPELIIAICIRSLDLDRPASWAIARDIYPPEETAEAEAARLYDLAREKLEELREHDHALEWEGRRTIVKNTQQAAWKALGINPTAPEAEKPGRRPVRRRDPDQPSRERQEQLEAAFKREKEKKAGRATQRRKGARSSSDDAPGDAT